LGSRRRPAASFGLAPSRPRNRTSPACPPEGRTRSTTVRRVIRYSPKAGSVVTGLLRSPALVLPFIVPRKQDRSLQEVGGPKDGGGYPQRFGTSPSKTSRIEYRPGSAVVTNFAARKTPSAKGRRGEGRGGYTTPPPPRVKSQTI